MQRRSCRVKRWQRNVRRSAALRRRGDPRSTRQWLPCARCWPPVPAAGSARGGAVQSVSATMPTLRCPARSATPGSRARRDPCRPPSPSRAGSATSRPAQPAPCDKRRAARDHRKPGRRAGRAHYRRPGPRPVSAGGWLLASAPSRRWSWPGHAVKRMRSRRWRLWAAGRAAGMPAEACGRARGFGP